MRTILVTGGCGYLGSSLVRILADAAPGAEVRILDNLQRDSHRALMDLPGGVTYRFLEGDVLDRSLLERALDGVDTVFHLAAIVRTPMTFENPTWMQQVNGWGTRGLADAAIEAGVGRFVFGSSTVVYGPGGRFTEAAPPRPVGPYAASKVAGENALRAAAGRGLDVRLLRLGMLYGDAPALRLDGVANRLAFQAATGRPVTVYGSGEQRRPFLHVDDAARALLHVADLPAAADRVLLLNAVSGNPQVLELAKSVVRACPGATIRYTDQDTPTHLSFEVDASALRRSGWRPETDHEAAMRALLARFPGLHGRGARPTEP